MGLTGVINSLVRGAGPLATVAIMASLAVGAYRKALDKGRARPSTAVDALGLGGLWAKRLLVGIDLGVLGIMLVPKTSRLGGWIALVFMALGVALLLIARARYPGLPCGCFGRTNSRPNSATSIGLHVSLVLLAALGAASRDRYLAHRPWFTAAAAAGVAVLSLVAPKASLQWSLSPKGSARIDAYAIARGSAAFQRLVPAVTDPLPQEWWTRGGWWFFLHEAWWQEAPAALVVAVHPGVVTRSRVRLALFDRLTHEVWYDNGCTRLLRL